MKHQHLCIFLGILFAISFISCKTSFLTQPTARTLPTTSDYPLFSISELNQGNIAIEYVNTAGWVAKISMCPPCPPGAYCKPCGRNNILLSDHREILESYPASGNYIILYTDESNQFKLGEDYIFSVKLLSEKSQFYTPKDMEIMGYQELPANK